jgi:hypothetical protein
MMATMVFPAPVSSTAMVFPRSAAANTSTWYLHAREPTSAQTLPHGRTARDQSPSISTPAAEAACAGGEEAGAAPAEVGAAVRRPRTWRRPPLVRCGWSGCGGGGGERMARWGYINRQRETRRNGERGAELGEKKAKCVRRWVWVAPWPVFVRWRGPGRRRGVLRSGEQAGRYRCRCGGGPRSPEVPGTGGFPLMGGWHVDQ